LVAELSFKPLVYPCDIRGEQRPLHQRPTPISGRQAVRAVRNGARFHVVIATPLFGWRRMVGCRSDPDGVIVTLQQAVGDTTLNCAWLPLPMRPLSGHEHVVGFRHNRNTMRTIYANGPARKEGN